MRPLLPKVILYHLLLIGVVAGLLHYFPQIEPYLPVGGLFEFQGEPDPLGGIFHDRTSAFERVGERTGLARLTYVVVMSISLISTQLVMLPISWVYRESHSGTHVGRYVAETLFILPIVVTAVVLMIKSNLALAFGLAGIVAGVQYRNRLKRPTDAAFLFAAIAVGIASGIQAIGVAIVMSLWFCVTTIVTRPIAPPETGERGR